jgi:hypothetical protein
LGTHLLVEHYLEELQTCFLEEVEENVLFSGTDSLYPLEKRDL